MGPQNSADPITFDSFVGERLGGRTGIPGSRGDALMKTLFILNNPPYGNERCYNTLRLAHTLLKNDL